MAFTKIFIFIYLISYLLCQQITSTIPNLQTTVNTYPKSTVIVTNNQTSEKEISSERIELGNLIGDISLYLNYF